MIVQLLERDKAGQNGVEVREVGQVTIQDLISHSQRWVLFHVPPRDGWSLV